MKEFVSTVGKPSLMPVPVSYMKEIMLQRNLMYVCHVGNPLVFPVFFKYVKELTLMST